MPALLHQAYIGVGSNLGNAKENVTHAFAALCAHPNFVQVECSSLYLSKPMGDLAQPDYVNAVVGLKTTQTAPEVLACLHNIESQFGRIRGDRWASRTLDLDLLLYDNDVIRSESLTLPHYGLQERAFVLVPLLEIAPELQLPNGEIVRALVERIDKTGLIKL